MIRIRRCWVEGTDPGPMIVDVDPPLSPHDVEIDLSGLDDTTSHPIDDAALAAFRRRARKP